MIHAQKKEKSDTLMCYKVAEKKTGLRKKCTFTSIIFNFLHKHVLLLKFKNEVYFVFL